MSKFISSANASIKVVDDASYMVNDALHINAASQMYNIEGWVKLN